VTPLKFRRQISGDRKLEFLGYRKDCFRDPMFIRFGRTLTRRAERETDRQRTTRIPR